MTEVSLALPTELIDELEVSTPKERDRTVGEIARVVIDGVSVSSGIVGIVSARSEITAWARAIRRCAGRGAERGHADLRLTVSRPGHTSRSIDLPPNVSRAEIAQALGLLLDEDPGTDEHPGGTPPA